MSFDEEVKYHYAEMERLGLFDRKKQEYTPKFYARHISTMCDVFHDNLLKMVKQYDLGIALDFDYIVRRSHDYYNEIDTLVTRFEKQYGCECDDTNVYRDSVKRLFDLISVIHKKGVI